MTLNNFGATLRSVLALLATACWCSLALILRPFWKRSVLVLQPYWARTVLFIFGVQVSIESETAIHPPVIYVANHQSTLDILVLIAYMPDRVRFVAKSELSKVPFVGWCMRAAGYLFIDRSNAVDAAARLQENAAGLQRDCTSIVIFPEGRRYPVGYLGPFKSGAIHFAKTAQTNLVPVGIMHTGELMKRKSFLCRSGLVNIHIGPSVDTSQWNGRQHELRDHIRNEVRRLAGESAALDVKGDLECQL